MSLSLWAGSELAGCSQATAPALDALDTAASPETKGHVNDTEVMTSQPAEKAAGECAQISNSEHAWPLPRWPTSRKSKARL